MTKGNDTSAVGRSIELFLSYLNNNIATRTQGSQQVAGLVLNMASPKGLGKMGVGATSVALSLYGMISESDQRHRQEMVRYVLSRQQTDGSWTISALETHGISLVHTTTYALQALIRNADIVGHEAITAGLDWVARAANRDGGFGVCAALPSSHVHPTAEVLFLLSLLERREYRDLQQQAEEWLMQRREEGTFWRGEDGTPSRFLTALAYRALANCGNHRFSLARTRRWLEGQVHRAPCSENIEYFIPVGGQHISEHITCFTQAAIYESLASIRIGDYDPFLESETLRVVGRQTRLGYWTCDEKSGIVPVFLNYHYCAGLIAFQKYLARRPTIGLISDLQEAWRRHKTIAWIITALGLLGLWQAAEIVGWIGGRGMGMIRSMNKSFENWTGIANFFQISGLSILVLAVAILRLFRRGR